METGPWDSKHTMTHTDVKDIDSVTRQGRKLMVRMILVNNASNI